MKSITFFSYKGGVGRTLCACNFAVYLARLGHRVAVLDFDFQAPGVAAKFPALVVPEGHIGLLAHILEFQRVGLHSGRLIDRVALSHPMPGEGSLWVLPAGPSLEDRYRSDLAELNWSRLFSEDRDGVRFFQDLLRRVERELEVDYVIIDSRSGLSEASSLCTRQLGDEVILMTSTAVESVEVTSALVRELAKSEIAQALGKASLVKVVLCRVARPEEIAPFKERWAERLGLPSAHLHFLFQSEALAKRDFFTALCPQEDERLTEDYLSLFASLAS